MGEPEARQLCGGERAARAIGWLEGFAALLRALGASEGAAVPCDAVDAYEEHVETLRRALARRGPAAVDDWEDCK